MNALCIVRTNVKVIVLSLLLICPFDAQSQSKPETDKKNQTEEEETSYLNVVGPLPYGQQPVKPKKTEKTAQDEPQESIQDIRLARLRELEAEHGPYHRELIAELINLGLDYEEQGKPQLARNAYMRSLEVHRVNFGLHNPDKFPIVEQLITVNRTLKKWGEVNKYYEYLYWLYRRNYGEDSVELIPILSAIIEWKTEAIDQRLFGDAKALYNEALRASRRANKIVKQYNANQEKEAQAVLATQ